MGTKTVVFHNATPMRIYHLWSGRSFPDPIVPMILICEASTWPAEIRYFDLLKRIHYVGADPSRVCNRRVFLHEKSSINTSAQVFGKMTVNVTADHMLA